MMGITKAAYEVEFWNGDSTEHATVCLHPTMDCCGDLELYGVFANRLGVNEDDITYYEPLNDEAR